MLKKEDAEKTLLNQYNTHTQQQPQLEFQIQGKTVTQEQLLNKPEVLEIKKGFVASLEPKLVEAIKENNLLNNLDDQSKAFLPGIISSKFFDKFFIHKIAKTDAKELDEIYRSAIESSLLIAIGKPIHGTQAFKVMTNTIQNVCVKHLESGPSQENSNASRENSRREGKPKAKL